MADPLHTVGGTMADDPHGWTSRTSRQPIAEAAGPWNVAAP